MGGVLYTLSSCSAISCDVEPHSLPAREQESGWLVGREETGAFLPHGMEKSTCLSERSWLGWEGSELQALQSFWNPLFSARPSWGQHSVQDLGVLCWDCPQPWDLGIIC